MCTMLCEGKEIHRTFRVGSGLSGIVSTGTLTER